MPWSKSQIITAQICRRHCGWSEAHYRIILRNVAGIYPVAGKISSTNPSANNAGFERFMSFAERDGYIDAAHGEWYWTGCANNQALRLHHKIEAMAAQAEAMGLISTGALPSFVERMTDKRQGGSTWHLRECDAISSFQIMEGLKKWMTRLAHERGRRFEF